MLSGQHIYLGPLTSEALPLLHAWINDREQVLFNAAYKPVSDGAHRQWFEAISKREDVRIFTVRMLQCDKLIGSCQLRHIDPIHRSAELQIRIGDIDERDHGYGTEALHLLLDFAFRDMNLHRVCVRVFSHNARALRAYEKVGFVKEGLLRQAAHIDGRYVDIVVMSVLRSEHCPNVAKESPHPDSNLRDDLS